MVVAKQTRAYVLQKQYCADDIGHINDVSVCHTDHVVKYYAQLKFNKNDSLSS